MKRYADQPKRRARPPGRNAARHFDGLLPARNYQQRLVMEPFLEQIRRFRALAYHAQWKAKRAKWDENRLRAEGRAKAYQNAAEALERLVMNHSRSLQNVDSNLERF